MFPMTYFELVAGANTSQDWRFTFQTPLVSLGRDPTADLTISCPTISRFHASVLWHDGCFYLRDLGSSNGTYVDGTRITSDVPIASGVQIGLGDSIKLNFSTEAPTSLSLSAVEFAEDGTAVLQIIDNPAPMAAPPILWVTVGQDEPSRHLLTNDRTTLGRAEDNAIVIRSHIVSRHHAVIDWTGDGYTFTPVAETGNTVYLNGKAITHTVPLTHESYLQLGGADPAAAVTMRVESPRAASAITPDPQPVAHRAGSPVPPNRSENAGLRLARNWEIAAPNLTQIMVSPVLNARVADGIYGSALRSGSDRLVRGKIHLHHRGLYFIPSGGEPSRPGAKNELPEMMLDGAVDIVSALVPGGPLIKLAFVVGKVVVESALASRPEVEAKWLHHPDFFYIPFIEMVQIIHVTRGSAWIVPRHQSLIHRETEAGRIEEYLIYGDGKWENTFDRDMPPMLMMNRFAEERQQVNARLLDQMIGLSDYAMQLSDRYVAAYGRLNQRHFKQFQSELRHYSETALAQQGYNAHDIQRMVFQQLAHFAALPRIKKLEPLHKLLESAH